MNLKRKSRNGDFLTEKIHISYSLGPVIDELQSAACTQSTCTLIFIKEASNELVKVCKIMKRVFLLFDISSYTSILIINEFVKVYKIWKTVCFSSLISIVLQVFS